MVWRPHASRRRLSGRRRRRRACPQVGVLCVREAQPGPTWYRRGLSCPRPRCCFRGCFNCAGGEVRRGRVCGRSWHCCKMIEEVGRRRHCFGMAEERLGQAEEARAPPDAERADCLAEHGKGEARLGQDSMVVLALGVELRWRWGKAVSGRGGEACRAESVGPSWALTSPPSPAQVVRAASLSVWTSSAGREEGRAGAVEWLGWDWLMLSPRPLGLPMWSVLLR